MDDWTIVKQGQFKCTLMFDLYMDVPYVHHRKLAWIPEYRK